MDFCAPPPMKIVITSVQRINFQAVAMFEAQPVSKTAATLPSAAAAGAIGLNYIIE